MHMVPLPPTLVGIIFVILTLALLLRRLRQPSMVAYLLTGVVLGPNRIGKTEALSVPCDTTSSTAQIGSQHEPDGLREPCLRLAGRGLLRRTLRDFELALTA
jgi:Kef-type K+ transport system membrane component KefB